MGASIACSSPGAGTRANSLGAGSAIGVTVGGAGVPGRDVLDGCPGSGPVAPPVPGATTAGAGRVADAAGPPAEGACAHALTSIAANTKIDITAFNGLVVMSCILL
jgi:hypothetical protein